MNRAAIYVRVATAAEQVDSQLRQLRELAKARGLEIVQVYCDRSSSGVKTRRPALDSLMADARQGKFDVVLVEDCCRIGRSSKHLLQLLDELGKLGIRFISAKEAVDTATEAGQMFMSACRIISALERSLSGEKIRQGMRRAEYEGQRLGRAPLDVDHAAIFRDRLSGMSLTECSKKFGISRASVVRFVREAQRRQVGEVGGLSNEWEHKAIAAEYVA
jgi:DNA invertase Pin-like site-specific DNA recombinase